MPKILPLSENGRYHEKAFRLRQQQRSCGSLFPAFCFGVGIFGVLFAVFALIRGRPVYVFKCGNTEDTLRSRHLGGATVKYLGWPGGLIQQTGGLEVDPGGEIRHKVLGIVGIQTGFGSSDRRKALRATWLPADPEGLIRLEQATGLAFRFVIGQTKDVQKMTELEKEIEQYKDFMLIDIEEEYHKLPYKTLAFFKAAYALFDADFYVKADDDIYLRPDRLATLLAKERPSPRTYIGCMKKGPVITDPKMKWYEPLGYLLGGEYFYHAYGPIYALSAEVVAGLAVARNDSFRMFSNEDVTIGSWMLAMNVNHEDNREICDSRCKPTSIAVWDIPKCSGLCNPAGRMRELHKIDMCSKSPTLPPDE
uniref:Hexosyltransferase n=1 Tax=Araucaria cunninghamii TaxID=56994 RepID=A0A0D6R5R8_ARACU